MDLTNIALKLESPLATLKDAIIASITNKNTFNKGKPYNRRPYNNHFLTTVVSLDTVTTTTRTSQHQSKLPPVLFVQTPDCLTAVNGCTQSSSSSMPSSCSRFYELYNCPGYLTLKGSLQAQDYLLHLAIIRCEDMYKGTKKEHPTSSGEVDKTSSATS